MFRERGDACFGIVEQPSKAGGPRRSVAAQDFAARVQDDPSRYDVVALMPAYHCCGDGQRDVFRGASFQFQLLGVIEDINSWPDLGGYGITGESGCGS